jgi:hypothetical protein
MRTVVIAFRCHRTPGVRFVAHTVPLGFWTGWTPEERFHWCSDHVTVLTDRAFTITRLSRY